MLMLVSLIVLVTRLREKEGDVFRAVDLPGSCLLTRLQMRMCHAELLYTFDGKILGDDITSNSLAPPTS